MMDGLNHAIKHLKRWMKPTRVGTSLFAQPGNSRIEYSPLGVTFIIGSYS